MGNHGSLSVDGGRGRGQAWAKTDTLGQFCHTDCAELLAWVRQLPLCHVEGEFCMVHAGFTTRGRWLRQSNFLTKSQLLCRGRVPEFMANLWGSDPAGWSDDLVGWARLRVAVNAMTRMHSARRQALSI